MTCPRLIEVTFPIREVSAESVRDKNIPSLHPKHIHVWWARRPLAASRAVVFASLVPDPDDPRCPDVFREAVRHYLSLKVPAELKQYLRGRKVVRDADPYRPYDGIADTLRNRLLAFIAKWSPEMVAFEAGKSSTKPKPESLLDDRSLAKWEVSDPDNAQGQIVLGIAQKLIRIANGDRSPTILDPFGGGGSIPLEAGRLGCGPIANDYSPVANLLLRATCTYPQMYGIEGVRRIAVEQFGKVEERDVMVPNVLTHDIEFWCRWIIKRAQEQIGHLYPPGADGRPVIGYLWARTIPCSNPSCRGIVPLLRTLLLSTDDSNRVALRLDVDKPSRAISYHIAKGKEIKQTDGTKRQRGPAICPICGQANSEDYLRAAGRNGSMAERMVAVIVEAKLGKDYRPVEETDVKAFESAAHAKVDVPTEYIVPEINSPAASRNAGSHRSISLELYGYNQWGQLFNRRQLLVMHTLVSGVREAITLIEKQVGDLEYQRCLSTYLGLWLDRVAMFETSFCRWEPGYERPKTPFGGQSIPMMWDYPEINPFGTLAGTAATQLQYMIKAVERQALRPQVKPAQVLFGSATNLPLVDSTVDCIVTDPPYGNSIAYADLSDFFYVWLKRSIGEKLPDLFSTPQTPKAQEATSHKHRHEGSQERANEHYRTLLNESFRECKRIAKEPKLVSVMFAHQSTEAWVALIHALLDAGLNVVATYPIETEMKSTALALGTASLESSITVVCRPREAGAAAPFREVRQEIEKAVHESVRRFWDYGFRGADLIVACYGPAVGVFGRHERVERADGTLVEVPELLGLVRELALRAIAGEFTGDPLSRLYFVWANLYGIGTQSWDDARLVVQIGGDTEDAMEVARHHGLFVVDGATCRLAVLGDRTHRRHLGDDADAPLVDQLHRAMRYWKGEDRAGLVAYLREHGLIEHGAFWKLAQALFEVLPRGEDDWKLISALLTERESLRLEARKSEPPQQPTLI